MVKGQDLDLNRLVNVVEDRSPITGKTTLTVYLMSSSGREETAQAERHVFPGDERWPVIDRILARYGPLVPTHAEHLLCGDPHHLIPWRQMAGDPTARQLELDTVYAALHAAAMDIAHDWDKPGVDDTASRAQVLVDQYLAHARATIRGRVEAAQEVALSGNGSVGGSDG